MARYKYRIVKDGNWRFELLPNNSNEQCVGHSGDYKTKEEMLDGLKRFKEFLRQNQNGISYMNEIFAKGKHIYHYAFFVFSDKNEKFYTAKYWHKYETDNSIERIINNFEVDIRDDLTNIVKER